MAIALWLSCTVVGHAQFLRLGPFDFESVLGVELIYTTNVENQRDSEADAEQEDYYIIVSLDLSSETAIAPSTTLNLDLGTSIERHANRPDLDNSENPFGNIELSSLTEVYRYSLALEANWERTSQSSPDTAFVGGESRLKRREQENYGYSAEFIWQVDPFHASALYEFSADRYLDEGDEINDKDSIDYSIDLSYDITRRLDIEYSYERSRQELINDPNDRPEWELTQRILLNFDVTEKPLFTYGWGYEKEDTGEDKEDEGEWEMIHTFNLSDDFDLTPVLSGFYLISYELEEVEEDDDVTFTYSAGLNHEISSVTKQSFTFKREPLDTFGSTTETDTTTYLYEFTRDDLILYGLTFDFSVSYDINKPLGGGPTEKVWTYDTSLGHEALLSSRLSRRLEYEYSREDSNLESELLEEHRVTLAFEYTF